MTLSLASRRVTRASAAEPPTDIGRTGSVALDRRRRDILRRGIFVDRLTAAVTAPTAGRGFRVRGRVPSSPIACRSQEFSERSPAAEGGGGGWCPAGFGAGAGGRWGVSRWNLSPGWRLWLVLTLIIPSHTVPAGQQTATVWPPYRRLPDEAWSQWLSGPGASATAGRVRRLMQPRRAEEADWGAGTNRAGAESPPRFGSESSVRSSLPVCLGGVGGSTPPRQRPVRLPAERRPAQDCGF